MAEGVGLGDVNPVMAHLGGSVVSSERRQASVMEDVPFGFMRRMLMAFVEEPVTEGRDEDMMREDFLMQYTLKQICVRRGEHFRTRCIRKKMIENYLLLHLFPIWDDQIMGFNREV